MSTGWSLLNEGGLAGIGIKKDVDAFRGGLQLAAPVIGLRGGMCLAFMKRLEAGRSNAGSAGSHVLSI